MYFVKYTQRTKPQVVDYLFLVLFISCWHYFFHLDYRNFQMCCIKGKPGGNLDKKKTLLQVSHLVTSPLGLRAFGAQGTRDPSASGGSDALNNFHFQKFPPFSTFQKMLPFDGFCSCPKFFPIYQHPGTTSFCVKTSACIVFD